MHTFIKNYLHFIKNCIRPPYKKLKSLKSGFIENSNFENNRDPCFITSPKLLCPACYKVDKADTNTKMIKIGKVVNHE